MVKKTLLLFLGLLALLSALYYFRDTLNYTQFFQLPSNISSTNSPFTSEEPSASVSASPKKGFSGLLE